METASFRLPEELMQALRRLAARRGLRRSDLVREALEAYLRREQGKVSQTLGDQIDALVDYPGSNDGDLATRGEEKLRERLRARRDRSR